MVLLEDDMGALTEAFDFVKRWAVVALLIIPCLLALQIAKVEAELAEAKLSAATERTDREIAARLHEANLAKREQTHATKQQEKEDDYSAEKLALEKRVAAERAASNSLRTQLASATARANARRQLTPLPASVRSIGLKNSEAWLAKERAYCKKLENFSANGTPTYDACLTN